MRETILEHAYELEQNCRNADKKLAAAYKVHGSASPEYEEAQRHFQRTFHSVMDMQKLIEKLEMMTAWLAYKNVKAKQEREAAGDLPITEEG